MRKILIGAAAIASLVACSGGEPAEKPEPAAAEEKAPAAAEAPAVEEKPAEEAAAFDAKAEFEKTCSTCHGTEGKGDGPAGGALNPKPAAFADAAFWADRDDASINKAIKEGGAAVGKSPLMAPYGGMYNDEQIAEISKYIIETWKPKS
ncbi:MAG: cytochrome c [Myxococcota bacterium]|nr:cytochrome c [Myxococcota bacterium]